MLKEQAIADRALSPAGLRQVLLADARRLQTQVDQAAARAASTDPIQARAGAVQLDLLRPRAERMHAFLKEMNDKETSRD